MTDIDSSDLRVGYIIRLDNDLMIGDEDGLTTGYNIKLPFIVKAMDQGKITIGNALYPEIETYPLELDNAGFKIECSALDNKYLNDDGTYRVNLSTGSKDMTREELDTYRAGTRKTGLICAGIGLVLGIFYFGFHVTY